MTGVAFLTLGPIVSANFAIPGLEKLSAFYYVFATASYFTFYTFVHLNYKISVRIHVIFREVCRFFFLYKNGVCLPICVNIVVALQ